jgi:hypothetical protein
MIRVCVCNGPWQLTTLAAALQTQDQGGGGDSLDKNEDYLVVHGSSWQEPLQKTMLRVAPKLHNWKEVVHVHDAFAKRATPLPLRQISRSFQELSEILSNVGVPLNADEVWITTLNMTSAKIAAEVFGNSAICLYEDGLASFAPYEHVSQRCFFQVQIREWLLHEFFKKAGLVRLYTLVTYYARDYRTFIWQRGALSRHLKRTRKNLYAPNIFPLPVEFPKSVQCIQIDKAALQSKLMLYKKGLEDTIKPFFFSTQNVLFLGAVEYQTGKLSRDGELSLYSSAVSKLVKAGYHVIWKDHPRIKVPFFEEIEGRFPGKVASLNEFSHAPVEAYLPDIQVDFCVGIASSTLFYAQALFGIETCSIARNFFAYYQSEDRTEPSLEFIMKHIPDLDEKLAQKKD